MALPSPPPAPQRGDRTTFSGRVDAFLLWLQNIIPALNTFLASITTAAGGGANTFAYTFDTATADADPGTGKLRLGSATQNEAVVMRLDATAGNGGAIGAFMATLAAGTSNIKGSVRLQRVNDVGAWLLFDITAAVLASGYWNLTLTPITGSLASPFVNNDTLMVFFSRHGNKGDSGGTPTSQQIRDAVGTLGEANGGTGATTYAQARANLGLGNVNNTSDANKPVSTAQTAAINARVAKSGDSMTGPLNITTTAGSGLQLVNTQGLPQIGFTGASWAKSIRLNGGNLEVVNSAYTAAILTITDEGHATALRFTGTSDETLKGNWRAVPDDFLERFAAIERAGLFDWNESGETDGGVGAQSVREIAPWCVFEVDGLLRVNYSALAVVVSHALTRRVLRNEVA